jgi:hypothetical protein
MGINEPRLGARGGNGREQFVAPELSKTAERRWYSVDVRTIGKYVWPLVVVIFALAAAWYSKAGQLDANTVAIQRIEHDVTKLQDTAKSKESAADDLAVIAVHIDAIGKRLDSIDNRLERMERKRSR